MSLFDDLFHVLPQVPDRHATDGADWRIWQAAIAPEVSAAFAEGAPGVAALGPFGEIRLPFFRMGAITSVELFGLDELILFSFYHRARKRYRRAVDFGANIGLHSIMLCRCGLDVRSFEPDPVHVDRLRQNLDLNAADVDLNVAAVSVEDGEAEFVRVKGNTTGSHIAGAKDNPYGDLDRFEVRLAAAGPHLAWADLAKIDIEGHEAALVEGLPVETWLSTDAVMEIGTPENAERIWARLGASPVRVFTQKTGWRRAAELADLPTSHREGSVFLTGADVMDWT